MKSLTRVLVAVALASTIASGQANGADLKAGDDAPDFEATTSDGKKGKLSSYKGKKNVVVMFSRAHW